MKPEERGQPPEPGIHQGRIKPGEAVVAVTAHTLIAAGTYIVAKGTLLALAPMHVAFFRFLLATLVMTLMARRDPEFSKLLGERKLILLGFLAIPANQVLFLVGINLSTATHAALLYSLTPGVVLLLSLVMGTERLDPLRTVGLVLALVGALWVLTERGLDLDRGPLMGDLLIFGAVVAWSLFSVLAKPLATKHGALPVTAWSFIWGTLMFLPLGLWHIRSLDAAAVPMAAWGGILYLAVPTSVVAYLLWNWALKWIDATQVAIFMNLQPPLTAVMSALIFKEEMTAGLILGGLVTLAGVTITNIRRSNARGHP